MECRRVERIDRHIIKSVEIGSLHSPLELEAGDELIKVNGKKNVMFLIIGI